MRWRSPIVVLGLVLSFLSTVRAFAPRMRFPTSSVATHATTRLRAAKHKILAPSTTPNPVMAILQSSTKTKIIVAAHALPLVALYLLVTSAFFQKLVRAVVDFVTRIMLPPRKNAREHAVTTTAATTTTTTSPPPPPPATPAAPAKSGFIAADESLKKVEASKPMGMLRPTPVEPTAAELAEQREAKAKEEQYQQEMRVKRWQAQRAAEKAALADGTSKERTVAEAVRTVFQADEPLAPEKERDVVGAAALSAAFVGFNFGGPLGALIAASAVSYFGQKDGTKAAVVVTGKAALGAVDLLKAVNTKFEVIKATENVLVEAVANNTKDSAGLVKTTLEATKAATTAALPALKETLGSTMDVTDKFLNKMEEISKEGTGEEK